MTPDTPTVILSEPATVPLVRTAAALESSELPSFAHHRRCSGRRQTRPDGPGNRRPRCSSPTTGPTPGALDILRARHEATTDPTDPHTIWIDGTQIQFQDVAAVTDDEIRDLDTKNLLYIAAHATALTTAEPVRIRAESEAETAEAEVPVATTGALVAMKLHAYVDRRGQAGPDKRSGDLWDIYNLLLLRAVDAARDLTAASPLLRDALCTTLQHELVDRAARARTVLRASRDERYQAITADELAHVATDLVNRLRP